MSKATCPICGKPRSETIIWYELLRGLVCGCRIVAPLVPRDDVPPPRAYRFPLMAEVSRSEVNEPS